MDYIEIVNWDEFQHYKERDPPWIKLYNAVLNKYEFRCLHDDSKLLLFALWLIASRTKNKTPYDLNYIKEQSGVHKRPTSDRIQELIAAEFIVLRQIDSTVIAPCAQIDSDVLSLTRSREERREEERREEERESMLAKKCFLDFVYLAEVEHQKLIERLGVNDTHAYIERLNNYIGSKGKKYKSHYHTILNWRQKDAENRSKAATGTSQPHRTAPERDFDGQQSAFGETVNV